MQKWNLHRRIALTTLRIFGTRPRNLIFGFMVSTAVMSMWVSNTAVVVMIFPIAMSVLSLLPEKNRPFTVCLMLAVAYSASIGGIGTLIGTPPNALFAAYIEKEMSLQLDFSRWFVIGLPVVVIFLPLTWWLLTRVLFSISSEASIETKQHLDDEFEKLGPLTPPEMRVAILFFTTAFLWIFRPWIQELLPTQWGTLDDAGIAMIASCALFTLPAGGNQKTERLLDWASAKTIPWDVLILFGGGLSLASALTKNGVAEALGSQFSLLAGAPTIVLIFMVAISITFLTEITSNTAIVATFLPILFSISEHLGVNPHLLLIPATLAASCAFMMPIATPPNAIVFSSGDLQIKDMARAGFLLNMAGTVIITLLTYFVYRPIVESW
jgi:sodium-dependent dicarboxylate transporter 2/3/5